MITVENGVVKRHQNYPVTTICGSMRYYPEMLEWACTLSRQGFIVIMPFDTSYQDGTASDATKIMLDDMHKRKIDMSESIHVVGSWRGVSTSSEIAYAKEHGKDIIEL